MKKKLITSMALASVLLMTACTSETATSDNKEDSAETTETKNTNNSTSKVDKGDTNSSEISETQALYQKNIPFESLYTEADIMKYAKEMIGTEAIQFTLNDLNGNPVSLSDYKGKNVILEMADTNCSVCQSTQPVYDQFKKDNPDVTFVGLFPRQKTDQVNDFLEKANTSNKENILVGELPNRVFEQYKVRYTPTLIFIDEDGIIRLIQVGSLDKELLELYKELAFSEIK